MHSSHLPQLVCERLPAALGNGNAAQPASVTVTPGPITAQPMLNYGGFVNRSFRVDAGDRTFHVKLTADAHSLGGLQTWRALAEPLAGNYNAPQMHGWMEVAAATPEVADGGQEGFRTFAGPVFEWIAGERPTAVAGDVRRALIDLVRRLHDDEGLRDELRALGHEAVSCARAYADTYHDRFVENMKLVRRQPPPFVDAGFVAWADDEITMLAATVDGAAAFAQPAAAASHRDLWLDNLMVRDDGVLFVLDWDEMGLGDPMMDWAMLFGPNRTHVRAATDADLPDLGWSAAERERLAVYARASVLDWTIDPLADWIDAAHEPLYGAAVRDNNRRVHEQALALYRDRYAS